MMSDATLAERSFTASDRRAWEAAARACYEQAGHPFPRRVVWVASPLAGALAAPIAACLVTGHRQRRVLDGVYEAIEAAAGQAVADAVRGAVHHAADGVTGDPVHGAAATALHHGLDAAVRPTLQAVSATLDSDAEPADLTFVHSADLATAVESVVPAVVRATVGVTLQDTIRGAIRTLGQARLPARRSVAWHAWFKLVARLRQEAVAEDETTASDNAPVPGGAAQTGRSVGKAVDDELETAGWWCWPFRDFVMFAAAPTELYVERIEERGTPRRRLHRADGPAVVWPDGFGVYYWHGVHVPRAVIDDVLTAEEILREPNAEVRRCAVERRGWDRFVIEAGLAQLGPAVPDPGNPGQVLTLHDVPAGVFREPVRVLLCTNGSIERDGTRRRFGLTVPASCDDPIEAAAWTYGLTAEQYASAQRRT